MSYIGALFYFIPVTVVRPLSGSQLFWVREVALPTSRATQCRGLYLGHPVSGVHKYRDLVLQVGVWARGWQSLPIKHHMSRNLKNRPDTGLLRHTPPTVVRSHCQLTYLANLRTTSTCNKQRCNSLPSCKMVWVKRCYKWSDKIMPRIRRGLPLDCRFQQHCFSALTSLCRSFRFRKYVLHCTCWVSSFVMPRMLSTKHMTAQ
jgi:hypothetical protein